MAINAGDVYSQLVLDASKYDKTLDKAERDAGAFSGKFGKVMAGLGAAFTVKTLVDFGGKAVQASADLQAMASQFDQVFKDGENEKAIDLINKQVDSLGINADRLTGTWSKFGGQVKGAGMESEQALEAVDKATRLAADAAAFYDRSLEDSAGALASFMKGNFEAGDAIGVFTNAKQMDVKANEMYGKSWADLAENERQWLLLDTVEKTYELSGAMGQASRESGAYQNVMGNLKATFERLYATIGEPILEWFLEVVQKVAKWVEENTPAISKTFENVFKVVKDVVMGAWEVFEKNLLPIFVALYDWVALNWPVISATIKLAFEIIKTVWDNVLWPVLSRLLDFMTSIFEWTIEHWPVISGTIKTAFTVVKTIWDNVLEPVLSALLGLFDDVFDWVEKHFPTIQATIETVFGVIGDVVGGVVDVFQDLVSWIEDALDAWNKWRNRPDEEKASTSGTNFGVGGLHKPYLDGTHAEGLKYVPYDGYVAELHKGERVLTAEEARGTNNPTIDEEKLADAIVGALKRDGLSKPTTIVLDGKAVGKGIVRILNSELEVIQSQDKLGRGELSW